jgi:quercetin dioxygenase-like cupin family protein
VRDKKQIVARGADIANAPPDAIKYTTKTFKFPHYTLIEAHVPKGTKSAPRIDDEDGLIYFLKGKFHVDIGGVTGDVGPGDVLYEAAGTEHRFTALADTVFVKISTPAQAR